MTSASRVLYTRQPGIYTVECACSARRYMYREQSIYCCSVDANDARRAVNCFWTDVTREKERVSKCSGDCFFFFFLIIFGGKCPEWQLSRSLHRQLIISSFFWFFIWRACVRDDATVYCTLGQEAWKFTRTRITIYTSIRQSIKLSTPLITATL